MIYEKERFGPLVIYDYSAGRNSIGGRQVAGKLVGVEAGNVWPAFIVRGPS